MTIIHVKTHKLYIIKKRSNNNKMLPSVKFAEYKVLTFLILREKC